MSVRKEKVKRVWLSIVFLVTGLLLWVSQTVRSTQLSYRIQAVELDLDQEKKRQIELNLERDELISLSRVEEIAKTKLGLIVPKDEDIVILTVQQ